MSVPRERSKQKAYTDVDTLNEVEAEALVYTGSHISTSAVRKFYRHTDTLLVVDSETLENTLADVMTEALIDVRADTLTEMEAKTLGDTKGLCESRVTCLCSK